MKERQILFFAPMVRAILDGTKTQTRRIVKPPRGQELVNLCEAEGDDRYSGRNDDPLSWGFQFYDDCAPAPLADWLNLCPYGQAIDRLYVREAWRTYESLDHVPPRSIAAGAGVQYEAGGTNVRSASDRLHGMGRLRRGIHMPRWASRIDLEIIGVRVERLQRISDADAVAEGIGLNANAKGVPSTIPAGETLPRLLYADLWDRINGAGSWNADPWVWVVEFKRVKP